MCGGSRRPFGLSPILVSYAATAIRAGPVDGVGPSRPCRRGAIRSVLVFRRFSAGAFVIDIASLSGLARFEVSVTTATGDASGPAPGGRAFGAVISRSGATPLARPAAPT